MADRYQQTTARSRRPLYAPPPAPGRQHNVLGYWVPLITVSTIALGGLAAWIWSERNNDDDEYFEGKPPRPSNGQTGPYAGPPGPSTQTSGSFPAQNAGPPGVPASVGGESSTYYYTADSASRGQGQAPQDDSTWYGRVRGAMRRTPSPQQFFDSASKQFGGAVAAAGAALGSIMEEDKPEDPRRAAKIAARERKEDREGFSDHERWSEEAEEKLRLGSGAVEVETARRAETALKRDSDKSNKTKKTVALVVSADVASHFADDDDDVFNAEHTSILSHLPAKQSSSSNVYILIYAPSLTELPPLDYQPSSTGIDSSYSQISTPAVTPGSELQSISPRIDAADSAIGKRAFDQMYSQALTLVSHPSHILPFTTATGFVQILRHLSPSLVYLSDALSGQDGSAVAQLKGWVGHTILVAGDEGHGGLADTETEDEGTREQRRWYERSSMVGLGKDVEVVDAVRVGEDWVRRIGGRE